MSDQERWPPWAERAEEPEPRLEHEEEHPPRGQSHNPVDRLTRNLPHGLRVTIDWVVTIVGAVAIVLAIKAWVVNPYRILLLDGGDAPLREAGQRLRGALFRPRARQPLHLPLQGSRARRHRRLPDAAAAQACCGAGGTFVKRLVGLPGERLELRSDGLSHVYIDGRKLNEPYIGAGRRDARGPETFQIPEGQYFFMGDNRSQSCDSREWGPCRART